MPATLTAGTWQDLIFDALVEINVYNPDDDLEASDAAYASRKLQRIIDQWIAQEIKAYNSDFVLYPLTPGHSPYLIGPGLASPDFAVATRPIRILSAALVLQNNNPATDLPLNIRDDQWWADQQVKGQTSNTPTDLYYSPSFPNGAIYLWPIGTFAYQLRLQTLNLLAQVPQDLTSLLIAAPAYSNATMLTLAEALCAGYMKTLPPDLQRRAMEARGALEGNNSLSPRISSADYGTRGIKPVGFNWQTGLPGSSPR